MRVIDILSESIVLSEGMMTYPNWTKSKIVNNKKHFYYLEPFLEGLATSQAYAFQVNGKNFNGIIQNPKSVIKMIRSVLQGTMEWKHIVFDVKMLDDENEPTGEIVNSVHLNQIYKDEKIKGTLNPNMGNVSEIILGCAITAKFEKTGQDITSEDVISMGRRLAEGNGIVTARSGKDSVMFTVKTVPFLDKKTFYVYVGKYEGKTLRDFGMTEEKEQEIVIAIDSSVAYANHSKRVQNALRIANDDPAENKVDVISDGGEKENQSTTKVDLKILVDGKESSKNLLSLKAGNVKQFGQVGGSNFSNLNEFFKSTVGITLSENVRSKFKEIPKGARDTGPLKEHNFNKGFPAAYKEVFSQLKQMSANDQTTLIKNVYKGLMFHLTRNEPGVEMVILSPNAKKAFQELSFGPEFKKAVSQLHLTVDINFTDKAYWMFIYGFPVTEFSKKSIGTAKHKLVELWSAYNPKDGVMRNRVGMGNLLKDVADLENIIEKKSKSINQKTPVNQKLQPATVVNPTTTTPNTNQIKKQPDTLNRMATQIYNDKDNAVHDAEHEDNLVKRNKKISATNTSVR
jgi:hypothetical protein